MACKGCGGGGFPRPQFVFDPMAIDRGLARFPYCIVWTPIPFLTWICPFFGHVGICTSDGVIRDFCANKTVYIDDMAYGQPTKYWQLSPIRVFGGQVAWDKAVHDAGDIYSRRTYLLFYDNCYSHVATALNIMRYQDRDDWNMLKTMYNVELRSKYVSTSGFLKTWMPFFAIMVVLFLIIFRTVNFSFSSINYD